MNNYKLIKLEQGYIVVSDEKIEKEDYYIAWETNYATEPKQRWVVYNLGVGLNGSNQQKIIASTFIPELPNIDFNGFIQSLHLKKECDIEVKLPNIYSDYLYDLYKNDIDRQHHFHYYDSGRVVLKKEYENLYNKVKITKIL